MIPSDLGRTLARLHKAKTKSEKSELLLLLGGDEEENLEKTPRDGDMLGVNLAGT